MPVAANPPPGLQIYSLAENLLMAHNTKKAKTNYGVTQCDSVPRTPIDLCVEYPHPFCMHYPTLFFSHDLGHFFNSARYTM